MERYYVIFKGLVQGVGFRYFVYMLATQYHMTGWIRNLDNGNVEMEMQGNHEAFFQVLEKIKKGNGWINISDYSIKQIPVINEKKFDIKL